MNCRMIGTDTKNWSIISFRGLRPRDDKEKQMEELKPCPFCGGTEFFVTSSTEDREGTPANITCDSCGCNGPWSYFKDKNDVDDLYIVAKRTRWNDRHNSTLVPCPVHSTVECSCKIGMVKVCKELPCLLLARHQ